MMLYAVSCAFTGGGVTGGSNASQDIGATQPMPDVPTVDPPADPFTGSGSFTIGSEYFNGSNVMKVNNEIHLLYLEDGGRFTLSSINIGGIGMTTVNTKKGTSAFNESTGVYTLSTDDGEKLYGRYDYESFILCNADGSSVDTVSGRGGNGETAVEIEVRRGNSDYGYRDLANNTNGAAMQGLYRMLRDVYEGFYGSDKDVSITEQGYVIATIPLAELGLSDKEIVSVWKIFGLENPVLLFQQLGQFH